MKNGYTGKVLFINLSTGSIKEESLDEKVYRDFIGGTGLGARILYERMKPEVDPLGPENVLGFVPGLLTGTGTPMTSRYMVVAKSPLTGTWGDANSGGYFGFQLKAAGYDAIFFSGISSQPVYLLVCGDKIELRDSEYLWGKDTRETQEILRQELGDKVKVACIGPSGESLSLLASVINDDGRAAGRCGLGAVMGAKKLKAIAVLSTGKVGVANRYQLGELRRTFLKDVNNKLERFKFVKGLKDYGTFVDMTTLIKVGATPIKNWSLIGSGMFPDSDKFTEDNITRYQTKRAGCLGCPIRCGAVYSVREGLYETREADKVEYETLSAFGPMCLNGNLESIIKANDICNRYGIDTISAGNAVAFAMECFENSVISEEETGGIELTWGNASAIIAMLEKIVKREGFGVVLADGVERAAKIIGRGSEKFAIHIHGQEPAYHDPRLFPSRGLGYISEPTPAHHMVSAASILLESHVSLGPYRELQPDDGKINCQRHGQIYAIGNNYTQTFSAGGMCLFAMSCGSIVPFAEFISAATGWEFTAEEAITTGRRIQTLRQAFNLREGLMVKDFALPDRIAKNPAGGLYGERSTDFNALRASYYQAMGWDIETGCPSGQTLRELGLEHLVAGI